MTVLFNSRGQPWTADGLSTSFYRHRDIALESENLPTIHDLRKTAATNMVILQQRFPDQITDQVLSDMFGWTSGTRTKMKRIYVSDAAVIRAMTNRG
jgi:integrase